MSKFIEVMAIVEGKTEQIFIKKILTPYLAEKKICIRATQAKKQGQNGGDIKFLRVLKDLKIHLKQRSDTYVTTMIDYYGVKEWPAIDSIPQNTTPAQIAETINTATKAEVAEELNDQDVERRFIPYLSLHEFEALLFSDSRAIASELNIPIEEVEEIITQCGSPEAINNSPETAPSKRLDELSRKGMNRKFPKTTLGINIAEEIGIEKMREKCPLFDEWLKIFEDLVQE